MRTDLLLLAASLLCAAPTLAAQDVANVQTRTVTLAASNDPGNCVSWLMWPDRAEGVLEQAPDGMTRLWLPEALPESGWQTAELRWPATTGEAQKQPTEAWALAGRGKLVFHRSVTRLPATTPAEIAARIDVRLEWRPNDPAAHSHEEEYACAATTTLRGTLGGATTLDADTVRKRWMAFWEHTSLIADDQARAATAPLQAVLPSLTGRDRAEALWRQSRAWFLIGEALPRSARRERLATFTLSGKLAAEALALAPDSGEAAFFVAASTGRYNTTKGLLKTITGLDEFEEQCQRAIDNGSAYRLLGFTVIGDAHHALGQFYRLVPDSRLAEMFLGTRGDIDRSIRHHEASLRAQSNRGDYLKELAISLLCKADREDDAASLQRARSLAKQAEAANIVWAFEDPELDIRHLHKLIERPQDACGYSRDQYEVD